MRPFLKESFNFCCAIYGTNVQIERNWKYSPGIFVVELKLKLRSLFHYEQIARENSDIK